jgi:hypothetical protein
VRRGGGLRRRHRLLGRGRAAGRRGHRCRPADGLTGRACLRYRIRDADGRELTVPSLADLAALHRQGFVAEDDLVRQETAERWVRAGELLGQADRGRRRRDHRWVWSVLFAAVMLAAALALALAARGGGQRP